MQALQVGRGDLPEQKKMAIFPAMNERALSVLMFARPETIAQAANFNSVVWLTPRSPFVFVWPQAR